MVQVELFKRRGIELLLNAAILSLRPEIRPPISAKPFSEEDCSGKQHAPYGQAALRSLREEPVTRFFILLLRRFSSSPVDFRMAFLKLRAIGPSAFEIGIARHREMTAVGTHKPVSTALTNHHLELAALHTVWTTDRGYPALSRSLGC